MKKKLIVLSGFVLGLAPVVALAQPVVGNCSSARGTLIGVICEVNKIIGVIVPVLIALGVVYFIWGVISYVIGTDAETKSSALNKIIYGIIGLVVIVGVWGLVAILRNTFGLTNRQNIEFPTVPTR